MPFSGGIFTRLYSFVADAAASIPAQPNRFDAEFNGVAAALSNCITRDGQSLPYKSLPMGGYNFTSLGAATTSDQATTFGQFTALSQSYLGILGAGKIGTADNSTVQAKISSYDIALNSPTGALANAVGQASAFATSSANSATSSQTQAGNAAIAAILAGSYPSSAITNVPTGLTQASVGVITPGSGGTAGTFALAWSGGNFVYNPSGTFTVAGGVVTAVTITSPGLYLGGSPTVPTPSFVASTGLTGAAVALTAKPLYGSGLGYWVLSADGSNIQHYTVNASGAPVIDTGMNVTTPVTLTALQANLAARSPVTIFTFGVTYPALILDSLGKGVGIPQASGPQPCFTFGNPLIVVGGDGNGLPISTGMPSGLSIVNGVRRLLPNARSEGLRIICVQPLAFDNTTPQTYQSMIETAQHFDAIRLVMANGGASAIAVSSAAVSVRADTNPTDNNNSATWLPVTFSGLASGSIPIAPGGSRVGYLVSDWIPISSIARTDGGAGGVAIARAYVSSAASITIPNPYNYNSAVRTGGFAFGARTTAGDCVTTISNFTSTTNMGSTPICGLNYAARGIVACVGACGDSITMAISDNIQSDGDVVRLAAAFTNATTIAFDAVNLGWTGTSTPSFFQRYQDFVNAGLRVDVCFYAGGSPNDMGTGVGTVTAAKINVMRQNRAQALRLMRAQGTVPILWTWGPFGNTYTTGTYFAWGSSDALRVADNVEIVAEGARGFIVTDFATALYGSTDGTGQQQPNPTYFGVDNVHPNAAGYALRATISVPALTAALTMTN